MSRIINIYLLWKNDTLFIFSFHAFNHLKYCEIEKIEDFSSYCGTFYDLGEDTLAEKTVSYICLYNFTYLSFRAGNIFIGPNHLEHNFIMFTYSRHTQSSYTAC